MSIFCFALILLAIFLTAGLIYLAHEWAAVVEASNHGAIGGPDAGISNSNFHSSNFGASSGAPARMKRAVAGLEAVCLQRAIRSLDSLDAAFASCRDGLRAHTGPGAKNKMPQVVAELDELMENLTAFVNRNKAVEVLLDNLEADLAAPHSIDNTHSELGPAWNGVTETIRRRTDSLCNLYSKERPVQRYKRALTRPIRALRRGILRCLRRRV